MRRGLGVIVVLVAVAAAAGAGWVAGQRVKSPAQVAYETEPPIPSLITAEVALTELAADVIVRADVGYDDPASLRLGGRLGGAPAVELVTSAPERGAGLIEGSVAIEISGRPVFLLVGEIPVFRDLRPKAAGPDVLQLEEALARLGYFSGDPDEEWDLATGAAVAAWYEAAGYEPNGISDEDQHRVDAARDQVDTAEDGVETAGDRVDAARDQVDTAEDGVETALGLVDSAVKRRRAAERAVSRARDRLDEAEQALAEAELGPDDLEIRRARSAVASAMEQLGFAQAEVKWEAAEADRAILASESARESAARDYSLAQSRWASARTGVHPDGGTVPSPSQMETLRLAVDTAELALEAAERGIEQAEAARDRKAVEGEAALRTARDQLAMAEQALDDLLAPPDTSAQLRAVEDARLGVETARSDLDDARSAVDDAGSDVEDARSAVDKARSGVDDALEDLEDARSDLVEAEDSLAELESETGTWLPAGELIFLDRLPVRVDLLIAERGSPVSGAFMTVTGSDLAVRGSVGVRDVALVKEGGEVWIDDRLLPEPLPGEIRLVEDRPGTRGVANDRHYLEIVADGIPDELVGKNVKVVIPVGGTEGEVLAVPAAALSATADGSTRVEVEQEDGTTRFVEVEPGLGASGLVEVTPLDGDLEAGDLVVVGVASDG